MTMPDATLWFAALCAFAACGFLLGYFVAVMTIDAADVLRPIAARIERRGGE